MNLTPEQRADLRATHIPEHYHPTKTRPWGDSGCLCCDQRWPCDAVKLLDEIDRLTESLEATRQVYAATALERDRLLGAMEES